MVTPFSWSQPHPVNEHVEAAAVQLRRRGHEVVVLASSSRARDLTGGRRALKQLQREGKPLEGTVAIGPAVRVSRRSRIGVPVGARANLRLALAAESFDIVHGHDPGLPSLSYLALRDWRGLSVATFHSPERLGYPPGRSQRDRLLSRIDAMTASGEAIATAANERFPGDYRIVPVGVEVYPWPREDRERRFVVEWRQDDSARVRAALRTLEGLDGWEIAVVRTRSPSARPYVPKSIRARVSVRTALSAEARTRELRGAAGFVPAAQGIERMRVEAAAEGTPIVDPPGSGEQPELVSAALERLAEDPAFRQERSREAYREAESETVDNLCDTLVDLYESVLGRRRESAHPARPGSRPWILLDLHLHTAHSHDCSIPVPDLLDYAEAQGLGGLAITDHNVFSGALEALELAENRDLTIIPGEEVKTQAGEVIGLFLSEEIPRGMTMAETLEAIRDQGGLVYMPHPFDRLHTIPDPATLHNHLGEIDVLEVYNARLLFEGFNDEALRFARKYNLTMGAGSDAHVLQGVGTGLVRMQAFSGPEEFLLNLRTAEILRRPKPLFYLQSLKWMAQARERRLKQSSEEAKSAVR